MRAVGASASTSVGEIVSITVAPVGAYGVLLEAGEP
jgi:hypothetical protein